MFQIKNPANGSIINEVSFDSAEEIQKKFTLSKAALIEWRQVSLDSRKTVLKKFSELLERDAEKMAAITSEETGRPIKQAHGEIKGTLGRIEYFLNEVEDCTKTETVFTDPKNNLQEAISHEPLGVIANISAWNYPYFVGVNVIAPALLTGNTVLYKPSEYALLTGMGIETLLIEAGLPDNVFQTILGAGEQGRWLLDTDINGVFFTGSYQTGKAIHQSVADKLIKVQLELGGKDPTYVCDDVDVKKAAASLADGAFYNNGQSCCSVERIYVHESIYDAFVDSFISEVKQFKMGDPSNAETYIGSLTRFEHVAYLQAQVKDAVNKGAKVVVGGEAASDMGVQYFQPTILLNVDHTMDVMREETFGPVIGIQKVSSDEEALNLMNDTVYGLTAGVYTPNEERAKKILTQVNSGSVYWNCCDRVSVRLPWSGRGHSGMGLTLSKYGIQTFTQPKAWHWVKA